MKNILEERPTDKFVVTQIAAIKNIDVKDINGKNVLDIGCGHGWFELYAMSKGIEKITGIEITEKDLSTAKKHIIDNRVSFKVGSAIKLPFEDSSFDTVVCIEVLEHIPRNMELKMFSEINRVLRKNGILYLSTPYSSLISIIFDPAWWLMEHRHYSKKSLILFGEKNKFKVLRIIVRERWWSLLSGLNMYIAKWIFHRKRFFEDFFIKKVLEEYKKSNGFLDIQVKYKKL